jgi:hypothetical protein
MGPCILNTTDRQGQLRINGQEFQVQLNGTLYNIFQPALSGQPSSTPRNFTKSW